MFSVRRRLTNLCAMCYKFYMDIWKHGKYFDMWSLVHFSSGFLLGGLFYWLGANLILTLVFSIGIMILWEFFEFVNGVIEPSPNVIFDIVIGFCGLMISISLFYWLNFSFNLPLFATVIIVTFVLAIWGFIDFLKRGYR